MLTNVITSVRTTCNKSVELNNLVATSKLSTSSANIYVVEQVVGAALLHVKCVVCLVLLHKYIIIMHLITVLT
jgi:hypothetical protein